MNTKHTAKRLKPALKPPKAKAVIAGAETVSLDALWWLGGGDPTSSHGFSGADAVKLRAAICAPLKPWPKLPMSTLTDIDAARYADICAKDLRRAAAFIKATWERDATGMIANAGQFPGFSKEPDVADWVTRGSLWHAYIHHAPRLVSYLRVVHPQMAAAWDSAVEPRLKNAGQAHSSTTDLTDRNLRMATSLTRAALQVEEIHAALVKVVGVSQTASRGEPLPMDQLIRLAGLQGPDANRKPMGRLLANLRSGRDAWQSVFVLCDRQKGKAHKTTTEMLRNLREKRLAEMKPAGKGWRLGAAAFPDKGATKGATI